MDGAPPTTPRVRGPQPLHLPAVLDPADGHARLYGMFREGRQATLDWNAAYIERHGLGPLIAQLEADGVGLPKEPRGDEHAEHSTAAPPEPVTLAVATGDNDPVDCECGLTVTYGGYLALHRMGDAHLERMAARGAAR